MAVIIVSLGLLLVAYLVKNIVYARTWDPLADIPGPLSCAISRLPYWYAQVTGAQVRFVCQIHKKYGPVVRIAPNEISYADVFGGQAWKDINGYKKGRPENGKFQIYHAEPQNGVHNMGAANLEDHTRVRRILLPAFSTRAITLQEPRLKYFAEELLARCREEAQKGNKVDLSLLFNCTTFDIASDLLIGEPLGLLKNAELTPWVQAGFRAFKAVPIVQIIQFYPVLEHLWSLIEPGVIKRMRREHFEFTASRVDLRLAKGADKPDILSLALQENRDGGEGMSLDEIHSNAELVMMAGTSCLSGSVYYLLTYPEKLMRLKEEIRTTFKSSDDMDLANLGSMKYLNACLQEGLRMYPPGPGSIPREIAKGGNVVLGRFLNEGTVISVHQTTTYRSPVNFHNPDVFAPERWMGEDPVYRNDQRDVLQPFSYGPRNCIGQNLAWNEMRLILAKMIFHFDIQLSPESQKWVEGQNAYIVWERPPLMVTLALAKHAS